MKGWRGEVLLMICVLLMSVGGFFPTRVVLDKEGHGSNAGQVALGDLNGSEGLRALLALNDTSVVQRPALLHELRKRFAFKDEGTKRILTEVAARCRQMSQPQQVRGAFLLHPGLPLIRQ